MQSRQLIGFALLSQVALAGSLSAAPILYDGFDYTNTASLATQNGGSGPWSGAWAASGTSFVVGSPTGTSGLSHPSVPPSGNSVVDNVNNSSTGIRGSTRAWDATGYTDDGDVLWFSALFRRGSSSSTTSDVKVGFISGSDPLNQAVGFQANGSGTLSAHISTVNSTSTLAYTTADTHLVVGRLDFSDTAGADKVTIWVDPATDSIPLDANGVSQTGTFPTGSYVSLRGGGTWTGHVDEIRIATTFDTVVPEPAALSLLAGLTLLAARRRR